MPTKSIKARIPQNLLNYAKSKKYDSNWESQYAELLDTMSIAGIIEHWQRCEKPRDTLVLTSIGGKCKVKYTPDFKVTVPNSNGLILIEVKGRNFNGREDRAGVTNFKHFAIQHPQYRFVMVTKDSDGWRTVHDVNPSACAMENEVWRKI